MTLAQSAGPSVPPLIDETIGANLDRTIAAHGGREALVVDHQGIRQTYAEFGEAVDLLARALLARGLQQGDRLGIWAPNCAEWVHLQYATAKVGVILVNINPAYRTSELEYALNQSGCRILVAAERFLTSDYVAMVAAVAPQVPSLEETIFLGTASWDTLLAGASTVGVAELMARADELEPGDAINIQYTSGTTGFPKGATLSHRNIINNGFMTGEVCGYTEEDRVCIPVPFYHCFGMVLGNLACTTHGAAIVVPGPSFDAEAVLRSVADERCTSLYGVPTMFIAELEHPLCAELDLTSLRTGIMAGAPCPVEVMKRVMSEMHMDEVTIAYGMTELSPVSTQTRRDDSIDRRVETVGTAHPHVEVRIADVETGATLERGATGEICGRGYSVMLGYWNDPDRTAEAIDADGWMHTGDLGTMDAEGFVRITGRIKDMIIRGGENIYPREIEEFLYTHPDVVDAQVIGVPDEKYGEEVMAWVQLRPEATTTSEDLRDFCRGRIAHFKIPRYVRIVDEYPMTITGKVQKFKMREIAAELLRDD
ncbi:MAG: AMP-binding protein [Acidimicrobiia bacterium]|nr:AMP-binding protein [Acidimicrobiia bacterium]